jgi:hypothetical protein
MQSINNKNNLLTNQKKQKIINYAGFKRNNQ